MYLKVFVNGDIDKYNELKPYAMKLGSAFQKVNFLRDANADFEGLGRTYFPGVNMAEFNEFQKSKIENDIENDFAKDAPTNKDPKRPGPLVYAMASS